MQRRLRVLVSVLGLAGVLAAAPARSDEARVNAEIRALLASPAAAAMAELPSLKQFYGSRDDAPAWVDDRSRRAALTAILGEATAQGISLPAAKVMQAGLGADSAARDIALTRLALDYASTLAAGRVKPQDFETDWAIPSPAFDAAAGLRAALHGNLAAWFASLPPYHPAYRRLVAALARYRKLSAAGGWVTVPRGDPLKLGSIDPRVRLLRERLAAEGDFTLPIAPARPVVAAPRPAGGELVRPIAAAVTADGAAAEPPPDPETVFDTAVDAAVRRFQRRHGIGVDGTVGPRTLAAMNVSVRARIQQIELNLERWRSLPHDFGASYIMVNVPAEHLDIIDYGLNVIDMKVVVGDPKHPTPVLHTTMVAVTLNPTWTIPNSIVKKELLPKARRDKRYLLKNDIVFTPGRGWQQLPGAKNPLGHIKFESFNRFDVYLHDTPARTAFDRYFRAQSHGCVRLEHAAEVAAFVLQGTKWDAEALAAAVATGATQRIDLKRRWPIYLVYATSFVDDDGTVEFRDDLYGRDARLRAALTADRRHRDGQKQAYFRRF